ncbi:GAF domain-containing protein [Frankia sp. AgB1.9]|uniref:GAF domain-containing protein n=1 Tax=unclassified Frankia TaxID=2632575 RepID=UPI00193197AE|nr:MULTISPECIES: GAF domain-containing protein [unclassified Frankia]MBL7494659.1 GAF domain-containing protein [Frankia sp. AgW1.1]MBL7553630.1 GAF domain-containing protein [Frankia sp. AgB1.9]MBL7623595.1 GAF domain-containing protein [Frankia sp. AgB1.8]
MIHDPGDVAAEIVTALRRRLDADRVTLRLDTPGMNFPCAAESTAPGVRAMSTDNSLDQRGAATAQWIMATRQVLVQPDLTAMDPAPPRPLMDVYGVRAQMLAPVVVADAVAGWLSVHSLQPRPWTEDDAAAIEAAAVEAARRIDEVRAAPGYIRWLP